MTLPTYTKDPSATLDWSLDWNGASPGPWLAAGETITASTWVVDQASMTITTSSFTGTVSTVWVSGGTLGLSYRLTNRITTSAGRTDERSIEINVIDR